MEPLFGLANQVVQGSLHEVAYSALPDAPVAPHTEPRHLLRHTIELLRRPIRHPAIGRRPARYVHEC